MQPMTTVMHLLVTDDWGGTEVQVSELVARSQASDAACEHVVAFLAPQGRIGVRLARAGCEVHTLAGPRGSLGALVRLIRLIRHRRPDVIEAYGFRAAMTARAAIALGARGPKLIVGVRGLHVMEAEEPDDARTRTVLAVERALSTFTAGYDANSHGAREFLVAQGFPAAKFTVIRNGVDPVRTEPPLFAAPGDRLEILCVARFVPRKQQEVLLRALAAISDLDVRCRFVGEGPRRPAMEALAADLGLNGAAEFCGRRAREDVVRMLLETDVFVLCSLWEGLPGSVLEAMTAGAAVIGTDVNGTRELIDDERTGLLVPANDSGALADALRRVAGDRELRTRLALAGWREATDRYSYDELVLAKNRYFREIAG
jgi:glycosyltransferase involved in cell wall biosynthesis